MSIRKKLKLRAKKRAFRVRSGQKSRGEKLRVTVFRSLNHIYAQIIDDNLQKTLLSFASVNLVDKSGDKKVIARKVGVELGKKAVEKKIESLFFDRGRYLYHGRVKALAEGLRECGLKF